MNGLDARFLALRRDGRKALAAFLVAGSGSPATSLAAFEALAQAGADVLEVGFPFSDPLADGPVIQAAGQRALRAGFTVARGFELVQRLASAVDRPILVMTYASLVMRPGLETFLDRLAEAGASGLIVPDLPLEHALPVRLAADRLDLRLVPLAAPTTTPERARAIADSARGFVYLVSLLGVTGAREAVSAALPELIRRFRTVTDLPLLAGFGVSGPEQAAWTAGNCDGVIVGSRLVQALSEGGPDSAGRLASDIRRALDACVEAGPALDACLEADTAVG